VRIVTAEGSGSYRCSNARASGEARRILPLSVGSSPIAVGRDVIGPETPRREWMERQSLRVGWFVPKEIWVRNPVLRKDGRRRIWAIGGQVGWLYQANLGPKSGATQKTGGGTFGQLGAGRVLLFGRYKVIQSHFLVRLYTARYYYLSLFRDRYCH